MSKKNVFTTVKVLIFIIFLFITIVNDVFNNIFSINVTFKTDDESPSANADTGTVYKSFIVKFTEAMTTFQNVKNQVKFPISKYFNIIPNVSGEFYFINRSTVKLNIDRNSLNPNVRYTINVNRGLKSLIGNNLSRSFQTYFDVDPFFLLGSNIQNNEDKVELKPKILLFFNHPVKIPSSINNIKVRSLENGLNVNLIKVSKEEYREETLNTRFASEKYLQAFKNGQREFHVYKLILPKLKKSNTYTIDILNKLQSEIGNLPLAASTKIQFNTYPDIKLVSGPEQTPISEGETPDFNTLSNTIRPYDTLIFKFNNRLKITRNRISSYISAVSKSGRIARVRNIEYAEKNDTFSISFIFYAREMYRITIKKGITDIFGQKTTEEYVFNIGIRDFDPFLSTPFPKKAIIESNGKINKFPFSYINLNQLNFSIEAFHSIEDFINVQPKKKDEIKFDIDREPKNKIIKRYLDLNKYLNRTNGFLKINIFPDKNTSQYDRNFFYQITDLAITAKYSPKNVFIYVTSLRTSKAVPYADVIIYNVINEEKKVVFSGKANSNGYIIIPHEHPAFAKIYNRDNTALNLMIFAKAKNDFTLLNFDYNNILSINNSNIDNSGNTIKKFQAFIFTPKGIYKEGETVAIKGFIRENKNGILTVIPNKKYLLVVSSPNGTIELNEEITTNKFGSFSQEYRIKNQPVLGKYSIVLTEVEPSPSENFETVKAEASFLIEAYKPRTFEVNVNVGMKNSFYVNNDNIPFKINARYYHGGILSSGKMQYRVEAYAYKFVHPDTNFKGYSFSSGKWVSTTGDIRILEQNDRTMVKFVDSLRLDTEGNFEGKFKGVVPFYTSTRYVVTSEVEDESRQSVVSSGSVIVHKAAFYTGFKLSNRFISNRLPLEVKLISSKPNGICTPSIPVTLRIYRREWNNVRKLNADGTYTWYTQKKFVEVKKINTRTGNCYSNIKTVHIPFTRAGSYIITLTSKDDKGNIISNYGTFYVWGGEYVPWQMMDGHAIDLIKDKETYEIGEQASIIVKSPYKKIDALVTVEREGVIDTYRMTLNGTADLIRIPIKPEYAPNVFVSVLLIQGRLNNIYPIEQLKDIYKPTIKLGYAVLYIKKKHKRLNIQLTSLREKYQPRDEVKFRMKVTDNTGRPIQSELSVYVVDEGVLSLINYQTPKPLLAFYQNRDLLVKTSDTRIDIMGQHKYRLKGENAGGSSGNRESSSSLGLSNVGERKIFKAIPYSKSALYTDANGYVEVSFKLPDNLTKFRVMIVAADKANSFGSIEKFIVVTKPIFAQTALPRFMNYQDTIIAGVNITNNTTVNRNVQVTIKANGVQVINQTVKNVYIEAFKTKEVRFKFKAIKIGMAEFMFTAISRHENKVLGDIIKWKIPVNMPYMVSQQVASGHMTDNSREVVLNLPEEVSYATSGIEVISSSTAMTNLRGNIEYLFGYPYGCLEQKMSRVLPMLLAGELVKAFNIMLNVDYRKIVQNYINELYAYQTVSGGFSTWPEARYQYNASPYLTSYVAYIMWMGKKLGYKINEEVYNKTTRYIKGYLSKNAFIMANDYYRSYYDAADVLSFYVLSEMKETDESYIDSIYYKSRSLSVFSKALMIKALYNIDKAKYKKLYYRLLENVLMSIEQKSDSALVKEDKTKYKHYYQIYLTDVVSTASVLQTLITIDKNNPIIPKLVRGILNNMRNGMYRTTQENMYVFWALLDYYKTYEKVKPNFRFEITAEMKRIMSGAYMTRDTGVSVVFKSFSALNLQKRKVILKINRTGKGRLYYSIKLKYAPVKIANRENAGFNVIKQIFDANTNQLVKNENIIAGKIYKIVLTVATNETRQDVVLDDPLAAGFEPLNPELSPTTLSVNIRGVTGSADRNWWQNGFNRLEMKNDRVLLFAMKLSPGTYKYTYFMKAMSSGDYILYPTRVEEMYNPDVFGTSQLRRFKVRR